MPRAAKVSASVSTKPCLTSLQWPAFMLTARFKALLTWNGAAPKCWRQC